LYNSGKHYAITPLIIDVALMCENLVANFCADNIRTFLTVISEW
jgi:hypothetical protein